jgi:hypothetical protein
MGFASAAEATKPFADSKLARLSLSNIISLVLNLQGSLEDHYRALMQI